MDKTYNKGNLEIVYDDGSKRGVSQKLNDLKEKTSSQEAKAIAQAIVGLSALPIKELAINQRHTVAL